VSSFLSLLEAARERNNSSLCVSLDLRVADTPLAHLYSDEPLFPVARDVIEATGDLVCAFAINPAYYLCEGAAGMVALERIVRVVPAGIPIIWNGIDAADAVTAPMLMRAACEQFRCAAVLSIAGDTGAIRDAATRHSAGVFVPTGEPHDLIDKSRDACKPMHYRIVDGHIRHPITIVSREVVYASKRIDFAEAARVAALRIRDSLNARSLT
jgi:hypothetical protein